MTNYALYNDSLDLLYLIDSLIKDIIPYTTLSIQSGVHLTFELPDQICNSPCRQPYNSYNVSLENLVLDQVVIPKLILFFILITYLVDNVLIL